ncbi:MAG: sensor histidine kinase [Gemmatimonadaceae bacterium]
MMSKQGNDSGSKSSRAAIAASEERFRTLVSVLTDVPWTTDGEGRFVAPQSAWGEYTGQSGEQMLGFGWIDALHPNDRAGVLAKWEHAMTERSLYQSHGRLWHAASRQYRHFEARATPIVERDGAVHEWVGACTDIHDRKQTEIAIGCQKQAFEMLASGAPLMDVLGYVAHTIESESGDAARVAIHVLDESGSRFEQVAAPSLPPDYGRDIEGMQVSSATGPCCAAVARRRQVAASDVAASTEFPAFAALALPLGIRGSWSIPILGSTGNVLGTVAYYYPDVRDPPLQDQLLGEIVTRTASVVIERKREEAERQTLLGAAFEARRDAEYARRDADAANRAKSEFLAAMSHELRTPLNAVTGYVGLIDLEVYGPVTREQHEAFGRIERSAQHLLSLIDDVLSFAKIEAGRLIVEQNEVTVPDLLAEVEAMTRAQIEAKGLDYAREPCPPTIVAMADRERAVQVLLNLVTNATKFTPSGGQIAVSCALAPDSDGKDLIRLRVRDSGIGIPREKLESIFEPFVQARRQLSEPAAGVGLGLAISRDLARAMGGDLTVESAPGAGSTFAFTLPLAHERRGAEDGAAAVVSGGGQSS